MRDQRRDIHGREATCTCPLEHDPRPFALLDKIKSMGHLSIECRPERASTCVLDVRDADFAGGHIPGVLNIWSEQFADDDSVDSIIKEHYFTQYKIIVVTCFMSQQRGPFCARRCEPLIGSAESFSRLNCDNIHEVNAPQHACKFTTAASTSHDIFSCACTANHDVSRHCRVDSRLEVLDLPGRPAVKVLYGGMRKFKQVRFCI